MPENVGKLVILGAVVAVAIGIIALVSVSLEKLNSDEVGLKYDVIQKHLDSTPQYEGLHNGPPGFEFIKFPSVFRTFEFGSLKCLNRDGVQITLSISYQYRVRPNDLHKLVLQFKDHDGFKKVLSSIGESALHDACSVFNTSQFQAERGAFQEEVRKRLVEKYDEIACDVTDLQVNNIQRPSAYEEAVRKKEEAREDIVVATNERPRKLTEAETMKREAETQAGIILDKAESDARVTINQAKAQAQGILNDYQKEAEAYKTLLDSNGLNLKVEGFLSYLAVRAIEDAKNPVHINMKAPAKTNWLTG